jgi:hypothetical protein
MLVRDMLMSPSAVPVAVEQGERSAAASVGSVYTILAAKCILQYVLSVVRNARYLSSLERAGRYIAVGATVRLDWIVGDNLIAIGFKETGAKPSL